MAWKETVQASNTAFVEGSSLTVGVTFEGKTWKEASANGSSSTPR
jgi:hypothetical protein